jgi:hypothetical protein
VDADADATEVGVGAEAEAEVGESAEAAERGVGRGAKRGAVEADDEAEDAEGAVPCDLLKKNMFLLEALPAGVPLEALGLGFGLWLPFPILGECRRGGGTLGSGGALGSTVAAAGLAAGRRSGKRLRVAAGLGAVAVGLEAAEDEDADA